MKSLNTDDLIDIILNAIEKDGYFSKEKLKPRIRAIIRGFRLDLNTSNYMKIKDPSETAKLMRTLEVRDLEKNYWKSIVKKTFSEDDMKSFYNDIDAIRERNKIE